MPAFKDLTHKHLRPWETVAEAVWRRYPAAGRFPERVELTVTTKRIGIESTDATIERKVIYDYSQQIPLLLRTVVNPAEKFAMLETMRFDWKARLLEIEVVNETAQPQVKYTERVKISAHPDSDSWTLVEQTGFYEVDMIFGVQQLGASMCEDIYQLNFFHNVDADVSLMQEFARGTSNEVVGYFPTYLRQLFLEDYDPSQLPPLPPPRSSTADIRASQSSTNNFASGNFQSHKSVTDSNFVAAVGAEPPMDEDEANRKLAWMFSPTPPIKQGAPGKGGAPQLEIPSRLGHKGSGLKCMQPVMYPMHTFAPGTMSGPKPPPLEIYGVSRDGPTQDNTVDPRAGGQGASSLVMF